MCFSTVCVCVHGAQNSTTYCCTTSCTILRAHLIHRIFRVDETKYCDYSIRSRFQFCVVILKQRQTQIRLQRRLCQIKCDQNEKLSSIIWTFLVVLRTHLSNTHIGTFVGTKRMHDKQYSIKLLSIEMQLLICKHRLTTVHKFVRFYAMQPVIKLYLTCVTHMTSCNPKSVR